jgi:hypothetical protein
MVHYVREDKFFDKAEHGKILMAPDLIQSSLFLRREKRNPFYLCQ